MKLNRTNKIILRTFTGLVLVLSACNSKNSEEGESVDSSSTQEIKAPDTIKTRQIFYNIPSPVEVVQLIKKSEAKYNSSYLNSVNNLSKYTSSIDVALNLGVYGCDLSFASIFEQTQDPMLYLKCCITLAEGLGIPGAFNSKTVSLVEANQQRKWGYRSL